jgi:hypothetical protein
LEGNSTEAVSSDGESKLEEDAVVMGQNSNESGSQDIIWSISSRPSDSDSVHPFIGWKIQEAAPMNKDSIPTN